jgi:hypothetical protein
MKKKLFLTLTPGYQRCRISETNVVKLFLL